MNCLLRPTGQVILLGPWSAKQSKNQQKWLDRLTNFASVLRALTFQGLFTLHRGPTSAAQSRGSTGLDLGLQQVEQSTKQTWVADLDIHLIAFRCFAKQSKPFSDQAKKPVQWAWNSHPSVWFGVRILKFTPQKSSGVWISDEENAFHTPLKDRRGMNFGVWISKIHTPKANGCDAPVWTYRTYDF